MRSFLTRRAAPAHLIVFTCACLTGCTPPPAVGAFAEQASLVLEASTTVTDDLPGSCERRHWMGQPLKQVTLLAPAQNPEPVQACQRFRQESTQLAADTQLVSKYFTALGQLARFNTVSISDPAGTAGTNLSSAGSLTPIQSDSVGKLSSLLTEIMTEHYRGHRMLQLIRAADGSVSAILAGMEEIADSDYKSMLKEEERTSASTFREASLGQSPSMVFLLSRAYREEVASGQRRSQAAAAYVSALREIAAGHSMLAKLGGAKSGEITAALITRITELKRLLPIFKAPA